MPHAYMYHGAFELNRAALKPGTKGFKGTDGAEHVLQDWPEEATGVRVGYMEKAGKHFAAVRVVDGKADIVLANEVLLDQQIHLGRGKRFSAEPVVVTDEPILLFLKDAIRKNPEHKVVFEAIRKRIKAG